MAGPRSAAATTTPASTSAAPTRRRRAAATPAEFLEHVRAGRVNPAGEQGSTEKWAHAAMALTVRALGRDGEARAVDPARVLKMAERLLREGDAREGAAVGDLQPADARALLRAWLASVGPRRPLRGRPRRLHAGRALHPRRPLPPRHARARAASARRSRDARSTAAGRGDARRRSAALLFAACIPAIPYAPSAAFIARERAKLASRDGEQPRVAIVADGIGAMHGVTRTIEEIRERGDRRLRDRGHRHRPERRPAAGRRRRRRDPPLPGNDARRAEPAGGRRGDHRRALRPDPRLLARARAASPRRCSPARWRSRWSAATTPSWRPTPACAPATPTLESRGQAGRRRLLRPVPAGALAERARRTEALAALGIPPSRVARWDRGVDVGRFDPAPARRATAPGALNVLYAGRIASEKNIDLLADAFVAAHAADPRLHLVLAGGGPEQPRLRRAARRARHLPRLARGRRARERLRERRHRSASRARPTPSARSCSRRRRAACRSLAVDAGGPRELIDGRRRRSAASSPTPRRVRRRAAVAGRRLAACCASGSGRPPAERGGANLGARARAARALATARCSGDAAAEARDAA